MGDSQIGEPLFFFVIYIYMYDIASLAIAVTVYEVVVIT